MSEGREPDGERGLAAAGVYVPRNRLSMDAAREVWGTVRAPGIETVAVTGADEDALTMAVAAADRALDTGPIDPHEVRSVSVATTTPPSAEGALAGRLAVALGLDERVSTAAFGGDLLAGAAALDRALDADRPALVVVSDGPPGEPGDAGERLGAGAAAFVVVDDAPAPVIDRAWHADEFPGVRYRSAAGDLESLGVRPYEREAVREGVRAAVDRLSVADDEVIDELSAAALHQPVPTAAGRLGRALDIPEPAVDRGVATDRIGDVGAAGVPVGLCAAVSGQAARDRTLAAFAGSEGGGAAFLFEGGVSVAGLADLDTGLEIDYCTALRLRGDLGGATVAGGGAHVSLPDWRRTLPQRYRLTAGRCQACDAVAFPPEGACPDCGKRAGFAPVQLERTGTIVAVTVIGEGGAPPEFADLQRRGGPFATAIVECDAPDGGAARFPALVTDCTPGDVAIGDRVRAVFRRLYEQEGVDRYGTKFAPIS